MTNIELRKKILELLYERFQEHPYNRITPKELVEITGVDLKTLHFNVVYLEEKGYLELQKPVDGTVFVSARITAEGIDLVEDVEHFNATLSSKRKRKT